MYKSEPYTRHHPMRLTKVKKKNTLFPSLSLPQRTLIFKPVTTFISYNLSQKGIEKGQDQFPIFHVNPHTLTVKYTLQVIFGIVVPYTFMGYEQKRQAKP